VIDLLASYVLATGTCTADGACLARIRGQDVLTTNKWSA
jgi:hypothetical protein